MLPRTADTRFPRAVLGRSLGRVQLGAHLPLIDFGTSRRRSAELTAYARTAADLGVSALAANDHLTFARPWLDGIVALASVVEASGELTLATTAALPVVRGPVALAQAAGALAQLSGDRLRLGVAAGSSRADYDLAGRDFAQRWSLFDQAVEVLRERLPGVPLWVASWGSPAGLRRVARLGDGWLASAYHTTPDELVRARAGLPPGLGCTVATMWTRVTRRESERTETLDQLAALLGGPAEQLADRVLVGPAEHCRQLLAAYADAGVDLLCLWPVGHPERELDRFFSDVGQPSPRSAAPSSAAPEAAPAHPPAEPR